MRVQRPINRIMPKLPVQAVQTFAIDAPLSTHWRPATCEEIDCPQHLKGWKTVVDPRTPLGQRQAHYIRQESRRAFHEYHGEDGLVSFVFPAGQRCFRAHEVREDRPEIFTVYQGDFRGRIGPSESMRAPDWTDKFMAHQDRLARVQKQG